MQEQSFRSLDLSGLGPISLAWERDGETWREVRLPGADVSDLPEDVRAEIAVAWTPEVVEAWNHALPDEPADALDPVPDVVEDWQLAGQAAAENIITREAALDWAGAGIVPPKLVDAVKAVVSDETERFDLLMFLRGSKLYPRRGPYMALLGKLFGKNDDAALDAFWIAAGRR